MSRLLKPALLLASLLAVSWGVKSYMGGESAPLPVPEVKAPEVVPEAVPEVKPEVTPEAKPDEKAPEATPEANAPQIAPASTAEAATPIAPATAPVPDLGDVVLGNPQAPVTVIAYESLTCSHCAEFSNDVFPKIKATYIDTGKVRYVFRDFPLDGAALQAAMLSRCVGADKRWGMIETLFAQQKDWLQGDTIEQVVAKVLPYAKLAGLTDDNIKACLADEALKSTILASRKGAEELKVEATPSFVINNEKMTTPPTEENVVKAIEEALRKT